MEVINNEKKLRKVNPWIEHVKTVKDKYPTLIYKDVLKIAKDSYSPPPKVKTPKKTKSVDNDELSEATKKNARKAKKKLIEESENIEVEAY